MRIGSACGSGAGVCSRTTTRTRSRCVVSARARPRRISRRHAIDVALTAILRAQLIQELTGRPAFKVSQRELLTALADEDETTRALAELVIARRKIHRE